MVEINTDNNERKLKPYLSPIAVWALSFGCAVGWGSFVMPGTTFLPLAGPVGTAIGMLVGGLVMFLIGINYFYLIGKYPDCGGTYAYTKNEMGYDHGFLSTWFLILVYIAIVWANVTAIPIICRNLFDGFFKFGFHYHVAGYDVYLGEIFLCLFALAVAGGICINGGRLSALVQVIMALALIGGVVLCAAFIFSSGAEPVSNLNPGFAMEQNHIGQIMKIVILAPWAFAGFESVAHSREEISFKKDKNTTIIIIIVAALITSVIAYSLLALMAASAVPAEYSNWRGYIADIGNLDGLAGLPTFHAADTYMGKMGVVILGIAATCAIMTGLVGNLIAASRLIYSMARDNMLPKRFTELNEAGVPKNALILLILISIPIPLFGRTAIGWIIDVNTIGATVAYAYTSAAACKGAKRDGNILVRITGCFGFIISAAYTFYFLVPNFLSVSILATESYLILIVWSILGFLAFRYVFNRDVARRFGRSTVVWICLLFMIFFLTLLWYREATLTTTSEVLANLHKYNAQEMSEHGIILSEEDEKEAEDYIQKQITAVNDSVQVHSLMQMTTIIITLFIMFSIYNSMINREKNMEIQKVKAEENSRAKTVFLSNMSHDIRTPMNAIIGYTELCKDVENLPEEAIDYLNKIEGSSKHLLALINDVLDMSRIESGKMELEITDTDLKKVMNDVRDMFATQMKSKGIKFTVDAENIQNPYVKCDANRLNRVLLNLLSNAYKFTPEGGSVEVSLSQVFKGETRASYQLVVKDSGMGMSPEFVEKVFEAYERDKSVSNIQGTGLGMAITKSIIDLMDGTIKIESEQDKGTEFIIDLSFVIIEDETLIERENRHAGKSLDYSSIRLLLVDDQQINRDIAVRILKKFGFMVESAENGAEALEKVRGSEPGYYQAVLMDIQMPVMNGYEATKAIRELDDPDLSSIPIVAMTANAFTEDIQTAMKAGMNSHISKPIDVNKMIETLNEVLA